MGRLITGWLIFENGLVEKEMDNKNRPVGIKILLEENRLVNKKNWVIMNALIGKNRFGY